MTETELRQEALESVGILVRYYPPAEPGGRPIMKILEALRVGPFVVNAGRWTDGGSIPPLLRVFADPFGKGFPGYLVHDTRLFDGAGWAQANADLDDVLRLIRVPAWKRLGIIAAVCINARWQRLRARLGLGARYVQ